MEQNKYTTVQRNLANEAMGLIGLMGEDTTVSDYQRAIRLVGKAHGIPNDTTEEQLKLIESAQNEMHRKCAGEVITEPLITDEIVGNWSALRIHETVMGLFEASTHLEQSGERMASLQCGKRDSGDAKLRRLDHERSRGQYGNTGTHHLIRHYTTNTGADPQRRVGSSHYPPPFAPVAPCVRFYSAGWHPSTKHGTAPLFGAVSGDLENGNAVRKKNGIKEGERKRPPSTHKAPQCGSFFGFGVDAPFRTFCRFRCRSGAKTQVPQGIAAFSRRYA